MLIPIPVGVNVAAIQGAVWKFVSCAHCKQDYAYLLKLEAVGQADNFLFLDSEGAANLAQAAAEHNFAQMCLNSVLPVPCPHCGNYQDDMVKLLKEDGTGNSNSLVMAGLIVAALSLIPLAFSIRYIWIVTVVGILAGLGLIAYADMAVSRYNPNAGDPEPRKARGRKLSIWGEDLAQLATVLAGKSDHTRPAVFGTAGAIWSRAGQNTTSDQ